MNYLIKLQTELNKKMVVKCKRCGRVLTNKLSIERGYGRTCYNIIRLREKQKEQENTPNEKIVDLVNKFNKISLKLTILERKFKNIEQNGVNMSNIDPIERIKQDNHRPERDSNRVNMANVIKEMKELFRTVGNVYDLLSPSDGRTTIEKPPIITEMA